MRGLNTGEYYGMIINMLIGLTLIVLIMIFFYMIYGEERGESTLSRKTVLKHINVISRLYGLLLI